MAKSEESSSIEDIIQILDTPSDQRQAQSVLKLMEHTQNTKFFKELTEKQQSSEAHAACCQHMFHEFCKEGNYLFRFGDKGSKFYIVIRGRVGIQVPIENEETGEKNFVEVIQLPEGAAFGELALENDAPRAASIQCKVDTHFAVLDKADYNRILQQIVKARRMEIVNFFSQLPLFRAWTKGSLTKLTYYFEEKKYNKKQIVYKEGHPANEIFIIREGEFKFLKKIPTGKGEKYKNSIQPIKNFYKATLVTLGQNEMFGEDDILNETLRSCTCICESDDSLVYSLSKDDFLKRIRSQESWNFIRSRFAFKQNIMNERVQYAHHLEEEKSGITPRKHKKQQFSKLVKVGNKPKGLQHFNSLTYYSRRGELNDNKSLISRIKGEMERFQSKSPGRYEKLPRANTVARSQSPKYIKRLALDKVINNSISINDITQFNRYPIRNNTQYIVNRNNQNQGKSLSVFSINSFAVYKSLWESKILPSINSARKVDNGKFNKLMRGRKVA